MGGSATEVVARLSGSNIGCCDLGSTALSRGGGGRGGGGGGSRESGVDSMSISIGSAEGVICSVDSAPFSTETETGFGTVACLLMVDLEPLLGVFGRFVPSTSGAAKSLALNFSAHSSAENFGGGNIGEVPCEAGCCASVELAAVAA